MTTLPDRPNTALLLIDVQNGVLAGTPRRDAVLANVNSLVDKARADGAPVVWVQHQSDELPVGSEQWMLVDEVAPREDERVVPKEHGDSFEGTDLEDLLAVRRVGKVVVAGAQSDACVRATIHGAFVRGYDTTLVADAHTTEDLTQWGAPPPEAVVAHTNLYWQFQSGPGKEAATVDTAEVAFS